MTERRGHVFYHHFAFTLLTTSTWQVSGYSFLTFSAAAETAPHRAEQVWQLLIDPHDFEEASYIIPKRPRCVAHVPVHPNAPADAIVPLAACAQLAVPNDDLWCSSSTSRRRRPRPGSAAWSSWFRRPVLRFAGASGVRRTCTLGSDGVLSTRGRGSGAGPFAICHYNMCILVFVSSI